MCEKDRFKKNQDRKTGEERRKISRKEIGSFA